VSVAASVLDTVLSQVAPSDGKVQSADVPSPESVVTNALTSSVVVAADQDLAQPPSATDKLVPVPLPGFDHIKAHTGSSDSNVRTGNELVTVPGHMDAPRSTVVVESSSVPVHSEVGHGQIEPVLAPVRSTVIEQQLPPVSLLVELTHAPNPNCTALPASISAPLSGRPQASFPGQTIAAVPALNCQLAGALDGVSAVDLELALAQCASGNQIPPGKQIKQAPVPGDAPAMLSMSQILALTSKSSSTSVGSGMHCSIFSTFYRLNHSYTDCPYYLNTEYDFPCFVRYAFSFQYSSQGLH
jgi:hypothetical protein